MTDLKEGPKIIFLQPDCCVDWTHDGRQWCEHDVWGGDCEDHSCAIEYVRADVVAADTVTALERHLEAKEDGLKVRDNRIKALEAKLAVAREGLRWTDEAIRNQDECEACAIIYTTLERLKT